MSDKKYDSEFIGFADEPKFWGEEGDLSNLSWSFSMTAEQMKEALEKYQTGKGYCKFKLFVSKSGKACMTVWNPNSEAAKEAMASRKSKSEDAPF